MPSTTFEWISLGVVIAVVLWWRRDAIRQAFGSGSRQQAPSSGRAGKSRSALNAEQAQQVHQGFLELGESVVHLLDIQRLIALLADIRQQPETKCAGDKEELALRYLEVIEQYTETSDGHTGLVSCVDHKEAVSDVIWKLGEVAGETVANIEFSDLEARYADRSISATGAWADVNARLGQHGLEMASIDDQSDSYQVILYQLAEKAAVSRAMALIGLPWQVQIE